MKIALWCWNENEQRELHSGGVAETTSPVDTIVFFDVMTYTASAVVPGDWTREQVDALLREKCVAYKTIMEEDD
jgi:hypothetical protein